MVMAKSKATEKSTGPRSSRVLAEIPRPVGTESLPGQGTEEPMAYKMEAPIGVACHG